VPDDDNLPVVYVRVMVNVDSLRKGFEGEVELTPRIQKLITAGYLQILGHVWNPPEPGPIAPAVTAPATLASPTRTRVLGKGAGDGTGADPA
jgi:hypothetical protein